MDDEGVADGIEHILPGTESVMEADAFFRDGGRHWFSEGFADITEKASGGPGEECENCVSHGSSQSTVDERGRERMRREVKAPVEEHRFDSSEDERARVWIWLREQGEASRRQDNGHKQGEKDAAVGDLVGNESVFSVDKCGGQQGTA